MKNSGFTPVSQMENFDATLIELIRTMPDYEPLICACYPGTLYPHMFRIATGVIISVESISEVRIKTSDGEEKWMTHEEAKDWITAIKRSV